MTFLFVIAVNNQVISQNATSEQLIHACFALDPKSVEWVKWCKDHPDKEEIVGTVHTHGKEYLLVCLG